MLPFILFCSLIGNKTLDMFELLDQNVLQDYKVEEKKFLFKNRLFTLVTGALENFSTSPIAFIGAFPKSREILYLDPSASPLLGAYYQQFISQVDKKIPSFQILHLLKHHIQNQVFEKGRCNTPFLENFFIEWVGAKERTLDDFTLTDEGDFLPVISIEAFIKKKGGICRQTALVTNYFLSRLIQDGYLTGKAYLVRDLLPYGGHAWSLFINSDGKAWQIDILWDILLSLHNPEHLQTLCLLYGKNAIDRQIQRYQI